MFFTSNELVLAADVAAGGTVAVTYPAGTDKGTFRGTGGHRLVMNHSVLKYPKDFEVTLGLSSATITNRTSSTWTAGTKYILQLEAVGTGPFEDSRSGVKVLRTARQTVAQINLGAPAAGAATMVTTAQLKAAAGTLSIDGTLATAGVAVADVPRNVTLTVATTDQSSITFTVTGTDQYGNAMVEAITGPNANTVQGVKAFATVTSVANSAAIATNGVSVGFGNKLGLPVAVRSAACILKEMQDGAVATAGTFVAAATLTPTSTSADVRGTYTPNATPDASKVFELVILSGDAFDLGSSQYAG